MYKIVFATGNAHKMKEIREILGDLPFQILSMKEAGIQTDILEDGTSFEENALIKARAVAACVDGETVVLADDSGIEVDAMGGEPGIYSARFMGEDTPHEEKCREILRRLANVKGADRSARFRCAIAAVFPGGKEYVTVGVIEGQIADGPRGENGFGYDPIFLLPERGITTAELSDAEKNEVSHRGRALEKMKPVIAEEFSI